MADPIEAATEQAESMVNTGGSVEQIDRSGNDRFVFRYSGVVTPPQLGPGWEVRGFGDKWFAIGPK